MWLAFPGEGWNLQKSQDQCGSCVLTLRHPIRWEVWRGWILLPVFSVNWILLQVISVLLLLFLLCRQCNIYSFYQNTLRCGIIVKYECLLWGISLRKESWTAYQNKSVLPPLKLLKSKARLCCLWKLLISWTRPFISLNKNRFSFSCYGKCYHYSSALFTVQDCIKENAQSPLDPDIVLLSLVIHLTHFTTFWEHLITTSAPSICWSGITQAHRTSP